MKYFLSYVVIVAIVLAYLNWKKSDKLKNDGKDNTLYKKRTKIAIVVAAVAWIIVGLSSTDTYNSNKNTDLKEKTKYGKMNKESKKNDVTSTNKEKQEKIEKKKKKSNEKEKNNKDTIIIEAGKMGKYGKELSINENTDMGQKFIGYFLPSGRYKVTNVGKRRTQVTVYQNKKQMLENGYEEWSDGTAFAFDVGEQKEINVTTNYFIKVIEPTKIELEKIDDNEQT